jgi:hypothetical protein
MSLRPDRLESKRLVWAFGLSLAAHLVCYSAYQVGEHLEIGRRIREVLQEFRVIAAMLAPPPEQAAPPPTPPEIHLTFMDVNPAVAMAEPPPNARYYSDKNSEAANRETDLEIGVPRIDGTQTEVVRADDVRRVDMDQLQPQYIPQDTDQEPQQARPRSPEVAGDLAMARPESNPRRDEGTAELPKPRTVREAMMRQNRNQLVGEAVKQEGGVSRLRLEPGFDTRATPFGVYDAMFISAVQSRWYGLLDNISYDGYRRGKVVLRFRLHHDGKITDMEVVEENVGTTLSLMCQKAVLDPAPYDRWSREMRLTFERDYREMNFTFFYSQ